MSKVVLIDIQSGSLKRLEDEISGTGAATLRCTGDFSGEVLLADHDLTGIVFHHKRADDVKAAFGPLGLVRIPVLVWYPATTSKNKLAGWTDTGAQDILVGNVDARELLARLQGLEGTVQSRLPWMYEAMNSLTRISRVVTSREDDFAVLAMIARELERLFPQTYCTILTISQEQSSATVISQGDRSDPLDIPLEIAKYPEIGKMLETLRPVYIKNAQKHPLMREVRSFIKTKDLYSVLTVPIFYRDQVIGLFMIRSTGSPRFFDRVEINFCEMVAQSTAIALRNLRLGREVAEEVARTREAERLARKKTNDLARMEAMFDHASDGIVVTDNSGRIKGVNVNFTRLSGYTKSDVEGKGVDEIIFPGPGEASSLTRLIKSKKGRDLKARRSNQVLHTKEGNRLQVAVRIEHIPKRKEWLVSLHDVTEEMELAFALRRTKDFLENMINSSMDAIMAADMNGTIILFNRAAEEISGYDATDVIGKMNIVDFYAPGVARDIMKKLRSEEYGGKGKLETTYNALLGSDGEEIPINMSAAIIYEEDREVASVGIFQDLRERIKIERELRETQERLIASQKKDAIMALSGAASHELNQPLTSILGYSELLRRVEKNLAEELPEHPAVASLKNATDIIGQEAERMAEVVRKIGEVSEIETTDYVGGAKIMDLDRSRGVEAEDELSLWKSIFQHMKEAVIIGGEDTVIRMANPASVVFTGENPVGKSFTRYLPEVEYTRAMEAFEKVKQGETQELELSIIPADGRERRISLRVFPVDEGRNFVAVYEDITESLKVERDLRSLSAFQDLLMKNTTIPLVALDIDGKITFWNKAAEKMFGYSHTEMIGKSPEPIIKEFDHENYLNHIRQLRKQGDMAEEMAMLTKDGEEFNAYRVDTVMRDESGEALGFLSMVFDFSDRHRFEEQLKEKTEQLSVIGDIADAVQSGLGMENVLGGVLENLSRVMHMDRCAISIADPEARDILVIGYVPETGEVFNDILRMYEDAEQIRDMIFMKTPTIYNDTMVEQKGPLPGDVGRKSKEVIQSGYKSIINYPLLYGDEVLGTIHVLSKTPVAYGEEDLDRLGKVASLVTMGLANARLFNQIQRQNLELSRRTSWLEETIRAGQKVQMGMRPDDVLETLLAPYLEMRPRTHLVACLREEDESGEWLRISQAHRYSSELVGKNLDLPGEVQKIIKEKGASIEIDPSREKTGYKSFIPEARTLLVVPLSSLDRWLGALVFESHHPNAFNEDEKVEIMVLAAQMAGALRNLDFYRQLDLAHRFQRGLIEDANALIFILEEDGKIALVNRALADIMGRPAHEVVGTYFRDFFERHLSLQMEESGFLTVGDKRFNRLIREVETGGSLSNVRATIYSVDGRESKAVFNTSSVIDSEGNFRGFIAIGQDMTTYEQIERQLLQSEKMATVGQMAAGIAHDLNNPITAIINYAAMLGKNESLDDRARSSVQQLSEEARRIENLAQNLMSYSKPAQEEMFPLDLRSVVLDSLSFSHYELSRGKVTVETDIPEDLPPVRGIKTQLQQVFINLLSNASQACIEKGGGKVSMIASREGDKLKVEISDNGIGIPGENLPRLFDPFFTSKPEGKGTGLGLLIVKEIVSRHQGTVCAESEQGKGSTFTVTLPIYSSSE